MKRISTALIFIFFSITLFSATPEENNLVKNGQFKTISGELVSRDRQWYLESENQLIALHMGPISYHERIKLNIRNRQRVRIEGFIINNDCAVVTMTINTKTYHFRKRNGEPLWSGSENRIMNKNSNINENGKSESGKNSGSPGGTPGKNR